MRIELLAGDFTVCKPIAFDADTLSCPFSFAARTDGELSLVCPTHAVPERCTAREDGWRAMRICGQLDFSLVGILASVASALATEGIPIFAVSTYDTDYVLVKRERADDAAAALLRAGYEVK